MGTGQFPFLGEWIKIFSILYHIFRPDTRGFCNFSNIFQYSATHRRYRRIPWRTVGFLSLYALPGAVPGAYLVRMPDASLIRRLFGGMPVVTGLPVLLRKSPKNRSESSEKP